MSKKNKTPRKSARESALKTRQPAHMSERAMRAAMRELMAHAEPPLPAPPGSVPPARWAPVRQAAKWRREIERDRAAGKPLPDFRTEGVLTLRRLVEHEWHKLNDICLMDDLSIVRFIGVAEDDNDFYYVCERLRAPRAASRRVYWSAVCECTSLRGRLDPKLYERIDSMLSVNGCKPVKRMLILKRTLPRKPMPGTRVLSIEPVDMTLEDLRTEIHAGMRGERERPRRVRSEKSRSRKRRG